MSRLRAVLLLVMPLVIAFSLTPLTRIAFAESPSPSGRVPRRALWIEVSANLRTLASREAIRAMVARARTAGIDTLIPEAKNAWGFVIYESAFVAHIRTSPLARYGYPPPAEWFPRDFDPLQTLIEEAHAAGLRVHPAVNAFGEGVTLDRARPTVGLVGSRPEWESVHLRPGPDGEPVLVKSSEAVTIAFVNAAHPEAQLYELAILWEILARYDVDGIVLDRVRFAGIDADFSALSRSLFETHLGRRVVNWPHDVLDPTAKTLRPGPLFSSWVAWRASIIQAYTRAASRLIRQMRPGLPVGMYVGGWYPTIFEVGQNWAQPEAPRLFPAWSDAWAQASLLPYLDYLMIGLYYRAISPWEAARGRTTWWRSVAGGAVLGREVTGGLPLLGTVWLDLYKEDRARAQSAIRAAERLTDGLMVFDLSDVEQGAWWDVLGGR